MKRIVLPALLFFAITAFVSKKRVDGKMDAFKWLLGTWAMESKNEVLMETWIITNDSTLSGESYKVKMGGNTENLEKVQLVYRGGNYYYIPKVSGQNNNKAVEFRISSYTPEEFVAENPQHDFPKRITYQKISKDSIRAIIDGGPANPGKRSVFLYSRFW